MYAAFVFDWSYDLPFISAQIYPKKAKKASVLSTEPDIEDYSLVDTSYTKKESNWNGKTQENSGGKSSDKIHTLDTEDNTAVDATTLVDYIMPNTLPQIMQVGNDKVMVFQMTDSSRKTVDSSKLVYSVYHNGTWSEPQAVLDDGTLDLYSDLQLVGDDLYLTWQNEKSKITSDANVSVENTLKEIAKKSEIYVAKYDKDTKTFVNIKNLTNNDSMEMLPRLAENGNQVTALWVTNSNDDFYEKSGTNTVKMSVLQNGSWSTPSNIYSSEESIDAIEGSYVNGKLHLATVQSPIGNTSTDDAYSDVYVKNITDNSAAVMITNHDVQASNLQIADSVVYYLNNGSLMSYQLTDGTKETITAGDKASFTNSTKVIKTGDKTAIVWIDSSEDKNTIKSSVKGADGYSNPVTIYTQPKGTIQAIDACLDTKDNWSIIANTKQDVGSDSSKSSLVYIAKKDTPQISLDNVWAEEIERTDNQIPIGFTVTNTSEQVIDTLHIKVTSDTKTYIDKDIKTTLQPGEDVYLTELMDISDITQGTEVNVQVYAKNQENIINNVQKVSVGSTDISIDAVQTETADTVILSATATNASTVEATTSIALYDETDTSKKLAETSLGKIAAGETASTIFTVNKSDLTYGENGTVNLKVTADTKENDYNQDNNTAIKVIYASTMKEVQLLSGIDVKKEKISYQLNDVINVDDLIVTASYTDGSQKEVKEYQTNVIDLDSSKAGEKTLKITYTEEGTTVTQEIKLNVLQASSSITLKSKTSAYTGKAIAIDKATVKGSTGKVTYTYYSDSACKKKLSSIPKTAGTYYVKAGVAADTNYKSANSNTVKLIITKVNSTITLKSKTVAYTGKAITIDKATVKGSTGKVTYTYYSDSTCKKKLSATPKAIGIYYVKATVKTDANYNAATSKAVKLVITPKKMATPSVKSPSRGTLQVSWNKDSKASGYQIRYSTKSSMSGAKVVTVKGASTSTKKISGLSKGKKYYVQICAYKTISGKPCCGEWSSKKSQTTKK